MYRPGLVGAALAVLGADPTTVFDGLVLQAGTGGNQPVVYVDQVARVGLSREDRRRLRLGATRAAK